MRGSNDACILDVHVPQSVLHLCPVLASRLSPGCRIYNVNPRAFCIIIAHLDLISTFEQTQWLSAPGRLVELTGSNDLDIFVRAWHLGGMLRLPNLQNDITKVFYNSCVAFLNGYSGPCPRIDPAPFMYLRSLGGTDIKAALLLFDFYADLLQNPGSPLGPVQDLPVFVQQGILNSGYQIRMRNGITHSGDRVGVERYAVREDDNTNYGELQIQPAV